MEWNCVKNRDDIKELFDIYDAFHDSCIVSLAYKSGNFVDSSNVMCFGNSKDCVVYVTFQRQGEPRTMELCFLGVRRMNIVGVRENYSSEILGASLDFYTNMFSDYTGQVVAWSNNEDFNVDSITECENITYIIADSLKWRIVEDN